MQRCHGADEVLNWYLDACHEGYLSAFTSREQQDKSGLRISSLGKPALLQALSKVGVSDWDNSDTMSPRRQFPLFLGHIVEAAVMVMLYEQGVDIHGLQDEVMFEGVPGHIDALYGSNAVLDVKSMSNNYYRSFTSAPDDDRGYITQLLCYAEACNVAHAYVVCIDKQFGEMDVVELTDDVLPFPRHKYLDRARAVIEMMGGVSDVPSAFDVFSVPPLLDIPNSKYKQVANNMKYGPWKNMFYLMTKPDDPYCYRATGPRLKSDVIEAVHRFREATQAQYASTQTTTTG